MEESLAELQVLLMEQQRSMDTMSDQLVVLSQKLIGLEEKTTRLESKIRQFAEISVPGGLATDEKPPHY
ncbi:MAG: SlyX family protein [Gammaproteobacteria bacterium]|nr:SlyX family protein [Gammaproteobacteria bacterium]